MRREDYLPWFEEVLKKAAAVQWQNSEYHGRIYDEKAVQEWVAQAESALEAVFPTGGACLSAWQRTMQAVQQKRSGYAADYFEALLGTFKGATQLAQDGRLGSLIDSIRVESEADLLEQAQILTDAGHLAAATVIAGGALETHLRHLVQKHIAGFSAQGSISAYNQAIGQERKKGNEVYAKADGDQVESWGKLRNEAAHAPGTFTRTKPEVELMIQGIRQFIARMA